jgi:hypothetical protein
MRYGYFDENGRITEAFDDSIIASLPPGAVELTQPAWDARFDLRLAAGALTIDPIAPTPEQLKAAALSQLAIDRAAVQAAGYTCTNSIKLQVAEADLIRWTQLMTGLVAFHPDTVSIRDYDNTIHIVTLSEATQMMAEVFAWGQAFLAETWALRDAILAG